MAYTLPNGSTVDMVATFDTAVPITSISNAAPAVVSSVAHGLTAGDIILVTSGWSKLNNRAFKVGTVTADTFQILDTDTTNVTTYPAGAGVGTVKAAATYVQIPQITGFDLTGGELSFLDVQFLESDSVIQIPTVKSALALTMTVADDPSQQYIPVVRAADETRAIQVLRLNLVDGTSILYPSIVTFTNSPTVAINELLGGTITAAIQGLPTRYERD